MVPLSLSRAALRPVFRVLNREVSVGLSLAHGRRAFVSTTPVVLEKKTMKLPGLGDSISEGTVVEWTASIGQAVKEGDVVALVETDKVTVDIKAEIDGVLTQQFSAIDDTIEVGQDLYEIDTEAEASFSSSESDESKPAETETQTKSKEVEEPAKAAASGSKVEESSAPKANRESPRTPSIEFLGKEGWARKLAGEQAQQVYHIPPSYGRPTFSEEEMEALVTGGASLAPSVKDYSSGAMFG